MQETRGTWVQSLNREDPLEEEMATHSIILTWKIPWTVGPGGLQSMGSWRARHKWALTAHSTRITKIRICFRGDRFLGKCFPLMFWASLVTQTSGKESACNAGDLGSIPELGRSLEKEMATCSSILAWRIPWTEEPGGLHGVKKATNTLSTYKCRGIKVYNL